MPERRFVLGVGAQKAGTTWLHRYIRSAPDTEMGMRKGYHIWDAVYTPECAKYKVQRPLTKDHLRRWLMQRSGRYYFHYFDRLLRRAGITGDITPSYSSLGEDAFRRIQRGFEARGIECKVVFLMRDPVTRCQSAARMMQRKNEEAGREDEAAILAAHYPTRHCEIRTRYDLTIAALESAFRPEQIYYGIYEEMFDGEHIEKLSRFIGIEPNADFSKERINSSEAAGAVPDALRAEIALHYADVYRICAERFPQTRELWSGAAGQGLR